MKRMKRILIVVLSIALSFLLVACGGKKSGSEAPAGSGNSAQGGAEAGRKFVVGFDAEFPPFGFIAEDGSYDGFDLALAEELCKRKGWEFEAVPIDWAAKDAELESGAIDCVWNGFTYTGREDQYTWSDPYVDNSIVIVVRADSGIKSFADLAGKTLMAQAASSAVDAVAENTALKESLGDYVELPDYNSGFMELSQGTVDAVAADLGVAMFNISGKEGDYIILDEPVSTEQYAVGFLKGNTALRDEVNAVLLEMAADGTMMKIAKDYVEAGIVLESLCLCK